MMENSNESPDTPQEEEILKSPQEFKTKSNYEIMNSLLGTVGRVSIKTDQIVNYFDKYSKEKNLDYVIKVKNYSGESNQMLDEFKEIVINNNTGFMDSFFFSGPSNKVKIEFYLKNDLNQIVETNFKMNKERDNPFYFKNYQKIKAEFGKELIREIKVNNGWIFDDYIITANAYSDNIKYIIRINKYTWSYLFRGTLLCNISGLEFPIIDKYGKIVGKIRKENPYNILMKDRKKGWTDKDYFIIDFPLTADSTDKILLIGLASILDILHISDKGTFN